MATTTAVTAIDPITRYGEAADVAALEAAYEVTITIRCQNWQQAKEVSDAVARVGREQHPYKLFAWTQKLTRR